MWARRTTDRALERSLSNISVEAFANGSPGRFKAMASSCEVLLDTTNAAPAEHSTTLPAQKAWRIEKNI